MNAVRYITYDSCTTSVMPPFNRLWAQISAVITCIKQCLDHLAGGLSS